MAQGERALYGDEAARENPEEALAGQNGEGGALGNPLQIAQGAVLAANTAQTAADAAQASANAASALASNGVLAVHAYEFGQGSDQGWVLINCTGADIEFSTGRRYTGTAANPAIKVTGLTFTPSDVHVVAMRVKLASGAWRGELYYSNAGHGFVDPYKIAITAPTTGQWRVLIFDLRTLADYMGASVTGFQFQFTSDAGVLDVDWIAVGRAGPGLATDLGNLPPGSVSGSHIADGAVGTPKLADSAVSDVKIADAAVKAAKIFDGAVTNVKIAGAAVDVTKLAAGQGLNLLPNGCLSAWDAVNLRPQGAWYDEISLQTVTKGVNLNAVWALLGNLDAFNNRYLNTAWIRTGAPGAGGYAGWTSPAMPVVPGKRYCASVYTGAHRCTVNVQIYWYDTAGAYNGSPGSGDASNAGIALGGPSLVDYKRVYRYGDAPANTAFARLIFYKGDTDVGQADSYMFACRAQFEEIGANATGPGPWVPPATSIVAAENILAGAIVAGKIGANAVGANELAANSIFAKHLIVTDFENLVPNSSCSLTTAPATTPEGRGLYNYGTGFSPNGWYRRLAVLAAGYQAIYITPETNSGESEVQCKEGDQFYIETRGFFGAAVNGVARIGIRFTLGSAGAPTYSYANSPGLTTGGTSGEVLSLSATAPAGARSVAAYLELYSTTVDNQAYFSNFLFRKKNAGSIIVDGAISALKLHADAIATSDYGESSGIPTAGFKALSALASGWAGAGAWSSGTTYAAGDYVISGGHLWKSLAGSNLNNPPATSPTWWHLFAPVKVGPGGMQIGKYTIDELQLALLTTVGRQIDTSGNLAAAWYRGNSRYDPPGGVTGGVPVLIDPAWLRSTSYGVGDRVSCDPNTAGTYPSTLKRDGSAGAAKSVYICTVAGVSAATGAGPSGTGSGITDNTCTWNYVGTIASQERLDVMTLRSAAPGANDIWFRFRVTIQPRSDKDNLDSLRPALVKCYKNDGSAPSSTTYEQYFMVPDRMYKVPGTPGDPSNASRISWEFVSADVIYYGVSPFPFNGYLRVKLFNVNGPARDRDFDFHLATSVYSGLAGEFTLAGSGGDGGGGGGGGGGCVDPETPVFYGPGQSKSIKLFRPGEMVWTCLEDGSELGLYPVENVEITENLRCRVNFKDGRSFVCSINHLVNVKGVWRRADSLQPGEEMRGAPSGFIRSIEYLGIGPVIKMPVSGAHTYLAGDGAWHHNPFKP